MSGLTGIHVNDSGIGHAYTINQVWNAGVDANGNATGYEKGGTLFGTMTTDEGVQPAFTIEVKSDGTYVFTLTAPLNHPYTDQDLHNDGLETSWEDNLTLGFGFYHHRWRR